MAMINSTVIGEPDSERNPNTQHEWDDGYTRDWKDGLGGGEVLYMLASDYIEDGSNVLDLGGGMGNEVQHLLKVRPNCKITILDISSVACESCKLKYPAINYIVGDFMVIQHDTINAMALPYDHITASQVLEHFDRPDLAMKKIMSLVSSGGTVTLGLPHNDQIYYWHRHRYDHDSYHFFKQYSKWVSFSDDVPLSDGNILQRHMYVKLIKE